MAEPGTASGPAGALPQRPLHFQPASVAVVAVGGVAGALARYGAGSALPSPGGFPLPTLLVNLVGAFALGLLLEALSRRGSDTGERLRLRLLAGTGFLGAFTTYSSLALETIDLLAAGRAADVLVYAVLTLLGGTAAAAMGILAGGALNRRTPDRRTVGPRAADRPGTDEPGSSRRTAGR